MKHQVGDKVRIKGKEWFDAQPKDENGSVECGADTFTEDMSRMCGKVVTISHVWKSVYSICEGYENWTDEMFDDSYTPEKSTISEQMIKNITEVIKKHNLGVCISENDGKLIIEPMKVEEDLPIDTPVMCRIEGDNNWLLRYYYRDGQVYVDGAKSIDKRMFVKYEYIIEFDKFDPNNIDECLKHNIVRNK